MSKKDEALKLAEDALKRVRTQDMELVQMSMIALAAIQEALAEQPAQQEPVAWLITDEKINSLQVDSIQRLIDRARHAHMTDIKLRINGQDEWYQADWLKHLIRATPPQRTWVGLTDEEIYPLYSEPSSDAEMVEFARAIEAKLKEKNQ